jgi:hypothetical protein
VAYQRGSLITAVDLNAFLASVRAIYGVGTGDRGYGQTAVTQADVAASDLIASSHWANLRSMISVAAVHQGTNAVTLPLATLLEVGDAVIAHEQSAPSNNAYDLNGMIAAIDANRLVGAPSGMALVPSGFSIVETDPWTGTRTAVADLSWTSEDEARHFFNAAGEIVIDVAVAAGDADSTDWNTNLSAKVGSIRIRARTTTNDGNVPSGTTNGFYNLTDSAIPLFEIENFGGVGRVAKSLTVSARRTGYVGTRGGNGTGIRITIVADDATGGTMNGALTASINTYRSTALADIADPSFSITSEWG